MDAPQVSALDVAQLSPLSPLDAYREDLSRQPNVADFGPFEAIWLIVACGLHRLVQLSGDEQAKASASFGESLEAIRQDAGTDTADSGELAIGNQIASLQSGLQAFADGQP